MPNTFLFAFGIFVAQHGPNIGLKPSETRKTPPLALLNPSPPRGAQIKQQFSSSPSWNLEMVALFPRRGLPQEAQKGRRNPHSCSKTHALFPRRKPPRQPQKGHGNPHLRSKMHTLFPLRKPPRQPQKGHRNPHFYCNVSPMMIFFGNQAVLPHCFFNVSFCNVFPNKNWYDFLFRCCCPKTSLNSLGLLPIIFLNEK